MAITDLLFPKSCLNCKRSGGYICKTCIAEVRLQKQICIECGRPAVDGIVHARCKRPWALDRVVSIWKYEKVIRTALLKVKYKFASDIAEELAKYVFFYLKDNENLFPERSILVPIPLARKRGNWRGFNQSEEVGKLISKRIGWGFSNTLLLRKVSRRPQTELKGNERAANVRGVFSLNPKLSNVKSYGGSIVLFDDVLTTGATLKEAGKILKRGGAKRVLGLTIAG